MKNPSSALEYKYTTASLGSLKIDILVSLCQVNVIVKLVGSIGLLAVTWVMGRTHLKFKLKVMCVCIQSLGGICFKLLFSGIGYHP